MFLDLVPYIFQCKCELKRSSKNALWAVRVPALELSFVQGRHILEQYTCACSFGFTSTWSESKL